VNKLTKKFTQKLVGCYTGLKTVLFAMFDQLTNDVIEPLSQLTTLQFVHIKLPSPNFSDEGAIKLLEGSFTNMRKAEFIECAQVSDITLRLLAQCPELVEISLEGTDMISDEGVLELTSSDLIKRNLCKITLGGCKQLSNDSLMALVARCKNINTLNISSLPKITRDTLDAIATNSKAITTIDVSWCRYVDDNVLDMFIAQLPRMETITMWGCSKVTDVGVRIYRRNGRVVIGKC